MKLQKKAIRENKINKNNSKMQVRIKNLSKKLNQPKKKEAKQKK